MKKLIVCTLIALVPVMSSGVNSFAATPLQQPSGQVVHSKADFTTLINQSRVAGHFHNSTQAVAREQALLKAAANIFDGTHSLSKYSDFLSHNGFIVFLENPPITTDSAPSDVTIYEPVESYDTSTNQLTLVGTEVWNSLSAVEADYPLVGYPG